MKSQDMAEKAEYYLAQEGDNELQEECARKAELYIRLSEVYLKLEQINFWKNPKVKSFNIYKL